MSPRAGVSSDSSKTLGTTWSRERSGTGLDPDERREREQGRNRILALAASVPVDEIGAHAEGAGAFDIVLEGIAHHHRGLGRDTQLVEDDHEDRRARLHLPVPPRPDPGVHWELEVVDERAEVTARVRDEPDLHA